jgi:hypothetical protein
MVPNNWFPTISSLTDTKKKKEKNAQDNKAIPSLSTGLNSKEPLSLSLFTPVKFFDAKQHKLVQMKKDKSKNQDSPHVPSNQVFHSRLK